MTNKTKKEIEEKILKEIYEKYLKEVDDKIRLKQIFPLILRDKIFDGLEKSISLSFEAGKQSAEKERLEPIHYFIMKDKKIRYLCNQATSISKDKITNDFFKVTCKNCFKILFNDYKKQQLSQETKRITEIIEKMLKENDDIIKSGKVLPKNVHIPFINGEELLSKINEVKNEPKRR